MTEVAIQIPDDLKPFIDRSVKSGLFSDAADFMINLLYNVKAETEFEMNLEDREKITRLRAEVELGIRQLRNGESIEFDAEDIILRGHARLAAKAQAHG